MKNCKENSCKFHLNIKINFDSYMFCGYVDKLIAYNSSEFKYFNGNNYLSLRMYIFDDCSFFKLSSNCKKDTCIHNCNIKVNRKTSEYCNLLNILKKDVDYNKKCFYFVEK